MLVVELWRKQPFDVAADSQIAPGLLTQLTRYRDGLGGLAAGLPGS